MSIVGRIRQSPFFRNLSVTDEKAWNPSLWRLIGSQSLAGENITEETALTYSAVWNAITLYSGTVSTLPLHLFKKSQKTKVFADKLPLFRVMYAQANPYMTAMVAREVSMAHLLTWGNSYSEIVRNGIGQISELWPIPPNRCTPEMKEGILSYRITVDSEQIRLPRERILHIPGLGFNGFLGYSVIAMARKSIGLGMAMETFGSLYFGQGTHPGVIVSHPGKLSQPAHDNLQKSLTDAYSGLGKSHKLLLLEEAMKIEKLGIPPDESQFLESRQFQIPEIARWFNLPPHKLKDLTKSSFNNIESEQISFVTDSILPWLIRLESNYNIQLLNLNEQTTQKLFFKHNVEGLLRGDATARGNFYRALWNVGSITQNEIREKEDMEPNPNPLADELFVPLNMIPLSQIGRSQKPREQLNPASPFNPRLPEDKTNGDKEDALPIGAQLTFEGTRSV